MSDFGALPPKGWSDPHLKATLLEYQHALEHVIKCGSCEDCKVLAQSALDGVNREMCLEMVFEAEDEK